MHTHLHATHEDIICLDYLLCFSVSGPSGRQPSCCIPQHFFLALAKHTTNNKKGVDVCQPAQPAHLARFMQCNSQPRALAA